jgi:proline dehydrogenase
MLRRSLLWLSERQSVSRFARRNRLARGFAERFVAGETVEQAVAAAEGLAARGITATLDLLGESVASPGEARKAAAQLLAVLDRMADSGPIERNISLKLTQLGFDVDEALCRDSLDRILERARTLDAFVRIDMEGSAHTGRTLGLFQESLFPRYGPHVGVVIQSALRRSAADVDRLVALGARVRLCKGAYREPPDVAFPDKRDVDRSYVALMERLLVDGHYPAIATHDEVLLSHARAFTAREGIPAERYEFQMLYGVRRDLQDDLRAAGYRVRVYVPFGTRWYPYLMRRLAERPANLAFILGNLVREGLRRR